MLVHVLEAHVNPFLRYHFLQSASQSASPQYPAKVVRPLTDPAGAQQSHRLVNIKVSVSGSALYHTHSPYVHGNAEVCRSKGTVCLSRLPRARQRWAGWESVGKHALASGIQI